MGRHTIRFERVQLYETVWAEPVRTVAKRLGMSDVALAKICRKLSVPIPGRGYWAEKQAGKAPVRPTLSKLPDTARTTLMVSRNVPDAGPLVDPVIVARVQEEKSGDPIVVAETLLAPHSLVERAAKLLRAAKPDDGLICVIDKPCLDVFVAPASLDRALRIVDALTKALDARGLPVEVVAKPTKHDRGYGRAEPSPVEYSTRVVVNGESIEWRLAERWRTEMGPPPPPPKEYRGAMRESWLKYKQPQPVRVPNGVLALEILGVPRSLGTRATWNDGKHQRVETSLNGFIAELFATADAMKRKREVDEGHQREWDERMRLQREAAQREVDEENKEKELTEIIGRWRLARDVRLYLNELVAMVSSEGRDIPAESRLATTLAWISAYADRVDPVISVRNKLDVVLEPVVPGTD